MLDSVYKIGGYIKIHLKDDFNLPLYVSVMLLLTISMVVNYTCCVKTCWHQYLLKNFGEITNIARYFALYASFYYGTAMLQAFFTKDTELFKKTEFWVKSLSILVLLSITSAFFWHRAYAQSFEGRSERYFMFKILTQFRRVAVFIIPLIVLAYVYDRKNRNEIPYYGLSFKNFDPKPYLLLFLICVPFVVWASFQDSFLNTYPRFKFWAVEPAFGLEKWQMSALFEVAYGIEFLAVETVFRGAMVIGLMKVMGRRAILPMTAVYCCYHFGKPVPEAIASIFGAYLLGILAYYSRNILGGLLIHLAVAYTMEITAIMQAYGKHY